MKEILTAAGSVLIAIALPVVKIAEHTKRKGKDINAGNIHEENQKCNSEKNTSYPHRREQYIRRYAGVCGSGAGDESVI